MPFINVKVLPSVSQDDRSRLAEGVVALMVTVLGKRREATSVLVEELAGALWTIGNIPVTSAVHIDVKVTKGTNSVEQKRAFLAGVFELVRDIFGSGIPPYSYTVIHEVDGDAWGYDGKLQSDRMR